MTLRVEGVWCKTRTEFDRLTRSSDYDLVVSYFDVYNRLIKSDPYSEEPSDTIISLYIHRMISKLLVDKAEAEELKIAYLFKNLNRDIVVNFKDFINELSGEPFEMNLIIVNRSDYPKRGVLSKFDNVRFVEDD
jgi:hypothetical protein